MKGKDLINKVIRVDVPDMEQVRVNCHQSAMSQSQPVKRLRWSVAAVIAACFLFATAAYAASVIINRLDTGGTMEFIMIPDDCPEYHARRAEAISSAPVYVNRNADVLSPLLEVESPTFDYDIAQIINEMLDGRIFTADGASFDLMKAVPNQYPVMYWADNRGHVLYDENGYEVGEIHLLTKTPVDSAWEPVDIMITSRANFEIVWGYNNTFEEATTFLGKNLRLPTVHMEGFYPPLFRVVDINEEWLTNGITMRFAHIECERWFADMLIHVENERADNSEPWTIYMPGEITRLEIDGVAVYKITGDRYATQVFWIHDGLVYRLIPSDVLTDVQVTEIIKSMVE